MFLLFTNCDQYHHTQWHTCGAKHLASRYVKTHVKAEGS